VLRASPDRLILPNDPPALGLLGSLLTDKVAPRVALNGRTMKIHLVLMAVLLGCAAPQPALAETPFEKCQRDLIVMNCVLNHPNSQHDREECARRGDPSTTPLERARWCEDHGYPPDRK
jgi:hypothetical protein